MVHYSPTVILTADILYLFIAIVGWSIDARKKPVIFFLLPAEWGRGGLELLAIKPLCLMHHGHTPLQNHISQCSDP